jgi:RNA polymerase sigma-70 factor, ECF subfamily
VADDATKLIIRAQSGDLRAFEDVLRQIGPPLRGYILRLVGNVAITEEITQEAFWRIWRGLGWLRDPRLFRAWAYRIATREAYRTIGRERKHTAARADIDELDALPALEADATARADIEHFLSHVSPAARVVLAAHYLEGLSLEETAAAADIPVGTVKSRLASGLKQMRALMETTP